MKVGGLLGKPLACIRRGSRVPHGVVGFGFFGAGAWGESRWVARQTFGPHSPRGRGSHKAGGAGLVCGSPDLGAKRFQG